MQLYTAHIHILYRHEHSPACAHARTYADTNTHTHTQRLEVKQIIQNQHIQIYVTPGKLVQIKYICVIRAYTAFYIFALLPVDLLSLWAISVQFYSNPHIMRRHHMETFSVLLAFCAGNSPVTGEFPAQRPVTRSFDVFFDLRLNQQWSKQMTRRWFETPSYSLWRCCNAYSLHDHNVDTYGHCLNMTVYPKVTSIQTRKYSPNSYLKTTLCPQRSRIKTWQYSPN